MRQFVVVGHDAPRSPDFSLDDLPGAGRMDLLARSVTASLLLSHGLREDVRTHLVLGDEFTVRFDSADLRNLHPDERSTAALVRSALEQREEAIGHVPVETSPGVFLTRMGLDATLAAHGDGATVCQLHEDGQPKETAEAPENPLFVLSDHTDFEGEIAETVAARADRQISLGPRALHADHAITVAHNWLDVAESGK
jgi:tRNA (pseudouridine54-N1)-methyltransferase